MVLEQKAEAYRYFSKYDGAKNLYCHLCLDLPLVRRGTLLDVVFILSKHRKKNTYIFWITLYSCMTLFLAHLPIMITVCEFCLKVSISLSQYCLLWGGNWRSPTTTLDIRWLTISGVITSLVISIFQVTAVESSFFFLYHSKQQWNLKYKKLNEFTIFLLLYKFEPKLSNIWLKSGYKNWKKKHSARKTYE